LRWRGIGRRSDEVKRKGKGGRMEGAKAREKKQREE